jgi:hypothetical protein
MKSRTRSVSQLEQPPRFFLDRSLGRKSVPGALRADGWDLITLAEHYGMPADEQVADTEWIEEAAKRGWLILMKDKRIRHRQAEIADLCAALDHGPDLVRVDPNRHGESLMCPGT